MYSQVSIKLASLLNNSYYSYRNRNQNAHYVGNCCILLPEIKLVKSLQVFLDIFDILLMSQNHSKFVLNLRPVLKFMEKM